MSLKIEPCDLDVLKRAVSPLDTEERRERYRTGQFPLAIFCQDVEKRYRFDLLYSSKLKIGDGVGVHGDVNLYAYMNDDHIDSALRSFITPLSQHC